MNTTLDHASTDFAGWAIDVILGAYLDCALWSSTCLDGTPLDEDYGPEDIVESAEAEARADIVDFLELLKGAGISLPLDTNWEQLGHDFWLTRNRHGAGFWDGGWTNGDALTKWAHSMGSVDAYVGDDELIYFT